MINPFILGFPWIFLAFVNDPNEHHESINSLRINDHKMKTSRIPEVRLRAISRFPVLKNAQISNWSDRKKVKCLNLANILIMKPD